jgi:hypothetical protein
VRALGQRPCPDFVASGCGLVVGVAAVAAETKSGSDDHRANIQAAYGGKRCFATASEQRMHLLACEETTQAVRYSRRAGEVEVSELGLEPLSAAGENDPREPDVRDLPQALVRARAAKEVPEDEAKSD